MRRADARSRALVAPPNLRCNAFMQRLLLGSVVFAVAAMAFPEAQAPAQTRPATPAPPAAPRPATPAPATPRPAPQTAPPAQRRPAPAPAGRGGLTITVTDMAGGPLRDIRIQAFGPTDRSGTTDGSGQLRITGLQAGTYRLRFMSEAMVEFEKEIAVRGGPNTDVDVSLRPAPPPVVIKETAPAPPPPPAVAPVGPVGELQSVNIQALPNGDFIRNEPRRETLLSCSANTRTTLVQMNQDQPVRLYDAADATYYVVAGEGTIQVDGRNVAVEATSFVSVPRGVRFSVSRRGRRPLIMIMQLSGEPCEEAK
jgi:mannose-6-phosphate isomerase-like protein (cupin superfamily)